MSSLDDVMPHFVIEKKKIPEKTDGENKKNNKFEIEIKKLVAFKNRQPFSLYDENKKEEMKASIKENGILFPIIVRKIDNDMYEIISGHNRVECSKELGLSTIPAQIVDCDDDKATLIMLDTNLCNRDKILPVEKGYAYKMKKEILKRSKNISIDKEFEENSPEGNDEAKTQIYRYIRLTELIKTLQEKVNAEIISIKSGVEISYLNQKQQEIVNQAIEDTQVRIKLVQAKKIRTLKNDVNYENVVNILKNEKVKVEKFTGKLENRAFKIYKNKFKSNKEFTDLIIKLLDDYFKIDSEA